MLRPIKGNKLQLAWDSPYTVVSKMSSIDYVLQRGNEPRKVAHVNMIRPYVLKENLALFSITENSEKEQKLLYWEGRRESKNSP